MVKKVGELSWLERMMKEYENDPEYLREYIALCSDMIKHLEQRVQELAAEIAEPSIKELDVLYRIRQAVAGLSKKVRELEADLADANKDIDTATESVKVLMEANDELEAEKKQKQPVVGDCKRNPRLLEAENARLRKRLEPIEAAYNTYKEYPTSAIVKRNAYNQAINKCMKIGEGK